MKKPKQVFTAKRKQMTIERMNELFALLRECEIKASKEIQLEAVANVMKLATDRAAKETNGQFTWEDVFGSAERMRFWLTGNDSGERWLH
jgi:hypothetical protein